MSMLPVIGVSMINYWSSNGSRVTLKVSPVIPTVSLSSDKDREQHQPFFIYYHHFPKVCPETLRESTALECWFGVIFMLIFTGLFHKVIMQSGSGLCDWALQTDPFEYAVQIGQRVRCPTGSRDELFKCLQSASTLDILRAQRVGKVRLTEWWSPIA